MAYKCINNAGRGRVESDSPMKANTHFAFRIDIWDDAGGSIVEHVAGVDDFEVAEATYRTAVARWPWRPPSLRKFLSLYSGLSRTFHHFRDEWHAHKPSVKFIDNASNCDDQERS